MKGIDFNFIRSISTREKVFLLSGGIFLTIVIGYNWVLSPFVERMRVLDRLVSQKEANLKQIVELRGEYLRLQKDLSTIEEKLARKKEDFSLLSYLEKIAADQNIRTNITSMKPQASPLLDGYRETSVEVKIEKTTLDQIVSLLTSIEDSPYLLKVKRLYLKTRFADPQYLDATFLVVTYEKAPPP